MSSLIILLFFFYEFLCYTEEVETAMKNILESYKYRDPNCTFNFTEVNSKTIEFFPKCKSVYGIIVINENTDLTPDLLQPVFKTMIKLFGGIRIENTKFTNISIFSSKRQLSVYCDYYGLYILNNTELYDVGGLSDILMLSNSNSQFCDIKIQNNPKLDMKKYCTYKLFQDLKGIRTRGNFKECDCEGDQITSENLPSYQSCTKLNYGLKLSNITDTTRLSFLFNVKQINGFIDIQNTSIRNFSFLKNLRFWEVQSTGKLILNLQNNPNMTRLPFGLFRELDNIQYQADVTANFENLHPDFCLTIEEFIEMALYAFSFIKLHAKLCKDHGDLGEYVLCSFKSMKELPNNCNILLGDLIIENGDEALMRKLMNVEYIFGSVIIRNTELKTFENLGYELCIIHLDDSKPLIQILGNKVLRDGNIPYLSYVATQEARVSIIQDNNPARSAKCELVGKYWKIKLNFTGGDCGERIEINTCQRRLALFLIIVFLKVIS
ncbi:unnamed protein product [Caenorhabditis brenneri]